MIENPIELTDAERIEALPLCIHFLAKSYNWNAASAWTTRIAIDLFVNERPAMLADILARRQPAPTTR